MLRLLLSLSAALTFSLSAFATDVAEAQAFMDNAEKKLLRLTNDFSRADWIKSTFITGDTDGISAAAILDYFAPLKAWLDKQV